MNNYNVFFAFGKAVESKESTPVKRYVGIAPVKVLAVNPTKAELEKLYNTTLDKEPEYLGSRETDGKNIPFVRVDFIVATDEDKSGVAMTTKVSFFIGKQFEINLEGNQEGNYDEIIHIHVDNEDRKTVSTLDVSVSELVELYMNTHFPIKEYRHLN